MKKRLGRTAFWVLWPLIYIYAPTKIRSRVLLVQGNVFLAVKPYFGSGKWQLPGGGVKMHEDLAAAAARELREETGIVLNNTAFTLLSPVCTFIESGLRMRYQIYVVYLEGPANLHLNHELCDAQWLPIHTQTKGVTRHISTALKDFDHLGLLK